jgi:Icc-related predicted phosphoesterase
MRLVFISDTHNQLHKITVPDGDFLIHAGDYSNNGTIPEVNKFLIEFSKLPHKHKILINGNHEKTFWKNPNLFMALIPRDIHFLLDNEVYIEGLRFYGSPHTKEFCGWAYPYFNEREAKEIWNKIPLDTDVLITHMPPYGIRDGAPYIMGREGFYVPSLDENGESVGCEVLRERVDAIKPKIHVFGHIHEGRGVTQKGSTTFINASTCTGQYKPTNLPIVVDINEDKTVKIISE